MKMLKPAFPNREVIQEPKKYGVEPDLPIRGTGIPMGDKQAHANTVRYDVSTFTYSLAHLKITSFRIETPSANAVAD